MVFASLLVAVALVVPASPGALEQPVRGSEADALPTCADGARQRVGTAHRTLVVEAGARGVDALAEPQAGSRVVRHFGHHTPEGVTSVFAVRERVVNRRCRATWYRVLLPMRPNGTSGWIRASAVRHRYVVNTRIRIDLARRELTFFRKGQVVDRIQIAIGASGTPTPRGLFYVFERLHTSSPTGPYGPGALGLSGFSPTLLGWRRGGPIAVHGTNQPWSIGGTTSNGCVRVHNSTMRRLLATVRPGTPVAIV